MLFWFKSAKKYNKLIPTQSKTGPLCVWKFKKDRVNLDTKSWPLGKGSTKISTEKRHLFPVKDRVNLDTKVGPLGKGQLKIDRKETFVSSGVIL